LVVVEQNAALAEYFSKYLVLGPEVIIDLLLPLVDPTGEDEMEEMPRLKNEVHGWTRCCGGRSLSIGSGEVHVNGPEARI
jgi:hypothetical protein